MSLRYPVDIAATVGQVVSHAQLPGRSGGIGRRTGLKIQRPHRRVGSTPTFGTFSFFAAIPSIL